MDEDRASWLNAPMGMFLAWSTSAFLVRAWAKYRSKTWGPDDYCLTLSLVTVIAQVACTYSALDFGYGKSLAVIKPEHRPVLEKLLYTTELLYVLAQGLCRASAALFIWHMAHSGPETLPARFLAFTSGVWTAASMLAMAIRGNISRPWSTMDGTQSMHIRWIIVETTGMVIEVANWFLAVHLIWSLQMTLRKRIYILSTFGVKLMVVIFIAFRLVFLAPARNLDPTLTSIMPAILTQAVLHFSMIASCVTTLKPFLRHFGPTIVLESANVSSGKRSRDPYYHLDVLGGGSGSSRRASANDSINWRPYQGLAHASASHDASATTQSGRRGGKVGRLLRTSRSVGSGLRSAAQSRGRSAIRSRSRGDEQSTRTDPLDRLVIERTTEVSVEHEDGPAPRT